MGGAIVTLDAQLVNLDVLPSKFKALTEIVEDWRLCRELAMQSSSTLWRTATILNLALCTAFLYDIKMPANSKIPSSNSLLGLMAAPIYRSLKNLVTRKCGGAHLYSYRIGACRRYLLMGTRQEFLYPRILNVNAEGSDDFLEAEDVDLRDDSRTMKTRYMVRESKKKVGGREDAEDNEPIAWPHGGDYLSVPSVWSLCDNVRQGNVVALVDETQIPLSPALVWTQKSAWLPGMRGRGSAR
ncbi:hypothetical protein BYT27DRAFT_7265507 [Phlegmacium glaucopus]|nr:hypothetical protein BYT27DRAFT_7265507 [Phlegmacium glaucopus]